MTKPIRVFLVDDHEVVLDGLTALFNSGPEHLREFTVIGRASSGREAIEKLGRLPAVDLVLLDISMPEMDGIQTAQLLKAAQPAQKIVFLTMFNSRELLGRAIAVGAEGYILKESDKEYLFNALKRVHAGETVLPPSGKVGTNAPTAQNKAAAADFTKRELQIIELICREMNGREIADHLHISANTIEVHRRNIMGKMGVDNVVGLVKYALAHQLVGDW